MIEAKKSLRIINDNGKIDFSQLTDRQKKYLFNENYMVVDFGGLYSGKTAELCASCLFISLVLPGNRGWICRQTGDKLEQSTMKEFFEIMGTKPKEAKFHPLVKYWNITKRELMFKNGSEIKFVSLEAEDSARGPNLGFYAVDQVEETNELTILDLDARCRLDRIPAKAWRALLIGNPAPGWCKRTFKDRNGSIKDFILFESTTKDLVHIKGQDYLNRLLKNKPQWWIDRYVYGKWGHREGQVFFKFSESNNLISRLEFNRIFKDDWPVIGAYDHGSNSSHPCAILYITWNPDKKDCFYLFSGAKKNMNVDDFAKVIKEKEREFSNDLIKRVADHDISGDRGIGTPKEEYRKYGLEFIPCRKKKVSNFLSNTIAGVNSLFGDKKLFIVDDMLDLIDEIQGWEYNENSRGEVDPIPKRINDDYCKCILYLYLELDIVPIEEDRALSHKRSYVDERYLDNYIMSIEYDPEMGIW